MYYCGSYNYIMQLSERGDNEMVTSTILSDMKSKVELLTNALDNESDKRQRFEDQVCGYLHQETYNTCTCTYTRLSYCMYVPTNVSIHLSIYMYLAIYLSIYLYIYPSITHLCLHSSLPLSLSLSLSLCSYHVGFVTQYPTFRSKCRSFQTPSGRGTA